MRLEQIETRRLVTWTGRPKQSHDTCVAVMESIRMFGFLVPILCDSRYEVISGHVRLSAARRLGMKTVPVIVLPVKGWKKRAFAIAENELSRKRTWKQSDIRKHLTQLSDKGFEPFTMGFDRSAIAGLLEKETMISWRSVDRQTKKTERPESSCMTIRVPGGAAKEAIAAKARAHAKRKRIAITAAPELVGAVVMDLLGVQS